MPPDLKSLVSAMAEKYKIPTDVFSSLIQQESAYNPNAVSPAGAIGLTQLMPGTAKQLGVDPRDVVQNVEGGARYLRQQIDRFGSIPLALAAYNAGPGAVSKYGGIPPYKETQAYVTRVMGGKTGAQPRASAAGSSAGDSTGYTADVAVPDEEPVVDEVTEEIPDQSALAEYLSPSKPQREREQQAEPEPEQQEEQSPYAPPSIPKLKAKAQPEDDIDASLLALYHKYASQGKVIEINPDYVRGKMLSDRLWREVEMGRLHHDDAAKQEQSIMAAHPAYKEMVRVQSAMSEIAKSQQEQQPVQAAEGGSVSVYDPQAIDDIVNGVYGYAEGGAVKGYAEGDSVEVPDTVYDKFMQYVQDKAAVPIAAVQAIPAAVEQLNQNVQSIPGRIEQTLIEAMPEQSQRGIAKTKEAVKDLTLQALHNKYVEPVVTAITRPTVPVEWRGGSPMDNPVAGSETGNVMDALMAFHGSPHKGIRQFDASKIGTGEGFAACGHGIYFSEEPNVANTYAKRAENDVYIKDKKVYDYSTNSGMIEKDPTINYLYESNWDLNKAKKNIEKEITDSPGWSNSLIPIRDQLNKIESGDILFGTGSLYKSDIPDEWIPNMLDWDKPLSEQSEHVKNVLKSSGLMGGPYATKRTGGNLIRMVGGGYTDEGVRSWVGKADNPKEASEYLRSKGIPGIKYFDQGSRGGKEGTRNFVVFPGREQFVSILEENGVPIKQTYKPYTGYEEKPDVSQLVKQYFPTRIQKTTVRGFENSAKEIPFAKRQWSSMTPDQRKALNEVLYLPQQINQPKLKYIGHDNRGDAIITDGDGNFIRVNRYGNPLIQFKYRGGPVTLPHLYHKYASANRYALGGSVRPYDPAQIEALTNQLERAI